MKNVLSKMGFIHKVRQKWDKSKIFGVINDMNYSS